MKLIDKLLLGLLVILLPLGLFLSQWLLSPAEETTESTTPATEVDITKLEQLIRTTVAQSQPKKEVVKTFSVEKVSYASESGILRVEGKAPEAASSILVSTSVLPKKSETPPETDSSSIATPVQVYSIQPSPDTSFKYDYEVDKADLDEVIEIRLDQNLSTKTIRFDISLGKQVL